MRAVQLRAYDGKPESISVVDVPKPVPGPNEVLIRVYASPINPSDLHFVRGEYGFKKPLPCIPGFEGSGTVEAAGRGLISQWLKGKRVAFAVAEAGAASGAWAQFVVTKALRAIPLRKDVDLESAATMIVNPMMAVALMGEARSGRHRAIVQTAAASALGKMVIRLARRANIPVINVVRRAEQVQALRGLEAQHVLDSSAPDFDAQLRSLCARLGATIAFDAVAGTLGGRVLSAQPKGSRIIVYGALSGQPLPVNSGSLIFDDKRVDGMWLSRWMGARSPLRQLRAANEVQALLTGDLRSEIQARLPLHDVARGLELYAKDMGAGKVLLLPQEGASA
ncbi:MAG: zinc-binding dehydrogenase [Candidatus Eremiobacteraeota bacterium]|nr:zinc-binding dehydrogenase [Candidatus Eremiobacteraeota bacterium]